MMKCLTLTQPLASLVALRHKRIETRDWSTSHRGELLITASKKFPAECRELCPQEPFRDALGVETLHTGKALCLVNVVNCFQFDAATEAKIRARSAKGTLPPFEADFGDYGEGRYGIVFDEAVQVLADPIPCKGALGLWNAPPELEEAVRRQLEPKQPEERPLVRKRLVQALDGNFGFPRERFSYFGTAIDGERKDVWHIIERGPKYSNIYEVVECNPAAEKWLADNRRTE